MVSHTKKNLNRIKKYEFTVRLHYGSRWDSAPVWNKLWKKNRCLELPRSSQKTS